MEKFDSIVIGAGLSGLVAAFTLQKKGQRILVLEKSNRIGGVLRSEQRDGFLLEHGPNTVLPKPALLDLINELNLRSSLQFSQGKTSRFVLFQGKLRRVPPMPGEGLLTLKGMMRIAAEPFIRGRSQGDEDVWNFIRRRLGVEVADRLVAPFVSGIWAGDPKQLSVQSAFPQLYEWESKKNSLLKGFLTSKKSPSPKSKGLVSLEGGLETLTKTLGQKLMETIKTSTTVTRIEPNAGGAGPHLWTVQTTTESFQTRNVILAQPAWTNVPLIKEWAPETASALDSIPYSSLAVLHLGFHRNKIDHPLEGFGFLVAPSEKRPILGCLWSSSLFPDRAPREAVLLTCFIGGATNPGAVRLSDTELTGQAVDNLKPLLGISQDPFFVSVTRYEKAIPQYVIGHESRKDTLRQAERKWTGLIFAGNYFDGIAVSDVIQQARNAAAQAQKLSLA